MILLIEGSRNVGVTNIIKMDYSDEEIRDYIAKNWVFDFTRDSIDTIISIAKEDNYWLGDHWFAICETNTL